MVNAPQADFPDVIAPPPLIFLAGLTVAVALNVWKPSPLVSVSHAIPIGSVLVGIAVALAFFAIRAFITAGTNVDVYKPSLKIVTSGPYRFSRNPIYLAMALFILGVGIWINTRWIFVGLILSLAIIQFGVIKREERYLTQKFGEAYLQYKRRVRRWL